MSESFANKPPSNPDKDTFYTMGGLQDIADFIGSAEQIAQLYPGEQNRPEYEPGLSDLRYTRSFRGVDEPGGSFYSPSGAGKAPAPFEEQIIYQQPMIQPGGDGAINEALLGALFGMDWTGAYEDYINKLESQRDVTNFMPNFDYSPSFDPTFNPSYSPSNTFNPTYAPSTNISNVVSPSITQNPSIEVNPNITNTLEQTQQQTMGGGSKTGQTQGGGLGFDFGLGDDSLFDADIGFADDGGVLDSDFFTVNSAGSGARTTGQAATFRGGISNNVSPVINQSPSINVSPTITNTLKQQQAQWMGGSGSQQDDEQDDDDDEDQQDDTVDGGNGTDTLDGGDGNDEIVIDDTLEGGTGNDTIDGGNQNDTLDGGNQTDTLDGGNGTDTLDGGVGNDTLIGGNQNDTIIGGNENDSVVIENPTASEQAVIDIYKGLFDREDVGDENLDYWSSKLDAGTPLETLIRQIAGGAQGEDRSKLTPNEAERYIERLAVDTPEERNDFITKAYQDLFERTPDAEGRAYWNRELEQGKTPTEILRDLTAGAQETDAAFLRNTKTVNDLYRDLLDREADAEGREYFRSQLEAGATPEEVARNLISGAKAGSEASKISQEEYERYFPTQRQEDTQQPTTGTTSNAVNNLFNITGKDIETANELAEYAAGFLRNQDLDTRYFSDAIRENFIADVATNRPDLLGSIVYDPKYATLGDEGMPGINTQQLVRDLSSALESEGYAELASLIGETSGLAGDFAGPIGDIVSGVLQGDNLSEIGGNIVATLAVNAAVDMGATALAALGIPGAGPFIAGALALDAVLSKALGYDSPIQDGITFIADMTAKGLDELQKMFGGAFESIGDFFSGIGGFFGGLFAEGGLVDLPGDSMYNDNTQGVLPDIEGYARGGIIPLPGGGKIAKGPGGGLDDLIPTSIDGRRAAALSDGEFVIPADVVSMMGDGSTNAGSKRLYDLVRQVRQEKTGTSRQAGPLQVGKILERTMR